jgi:hypothetical protein
MAASLAAGAAAPPFCGLRPPRRGHATTTSCSLCTVHRHKRLTRGGRLTIAELVLWSQQFVHIFSQLRTKPQFCGVQLVVFGHPKPPLAVDFCWCVEHRKHTCQPHDTCRQHRRAQQALPCCVGETAANEAEKTAYMTVRCEWRTTTTTTASRGAAAIDPTTGRRTDPLDTGTSWSAGALRPVCALFCRRPHWAVGLCKLPR